MIATRIAALVAASALAACTLELDESATMNAGALQFSDAATLSPSPADTALMGDVTDQTDASSGDFFGALFAPTISTSTAPELGHSFGEPVAYGEIARVCDAPRTPGTKVASVGGFTIFDSNPGSTQLRPHYITGFDDRCARQFSSALTLTGDVGTHEVVRYLPSNKATFNKTDAAYEAIKSRFCRVGQGKPCGSRLDALARTTTFITAYETFGSRPRWVEILLHDGDMAAIDFKKN